MVYAISNAPVKKRISRSIKLAKESSCRKIFRRSETAGVAGCLGGRRLGDRERDERKCVCVCVFCD